MAENNTGKEKLFREKSLERIESPEKLNDYLRVTSPGVWLVLATIVVLLAGVCIWGVFGRIDATVSAAVVSRDGSSVCYVPETALEGAVKTQMVRIDGRELTLTPSALEPETVTETTDVYVRLAGNLQVGDVFYQIPVSEDLDEGIYKGTLVTETLSPASLFF
ncbi:MAG: hypothetical protein IJ123_03665 [Blautia sp.]|nr:hypothetical protein [Blautia sp.]